MSGEKVSSFDKKLAVFGRNLAVLIGDRASLMGFAVGNALHSRAYALAHKAAQVLQQALCTASRPCSRSSCNISQMDPRTKCGISNSTANNGAFQLDLHLKQVHCTSIFMGGTGGGTVGLNRISHLTFTCSARIKV